MGSQTCKIWAERLEQSGQKIYQTERKCLNLIEIIESETFEALKNSSCLVLVSFLYVRYILFHKIQVGTTCARTNESKLAFERLRIEIENVFGLPFRFEILKRIGYKSFAFLGF